MKAKSVFATGVLWVVFLVSVPLATAGAGKDEAALHAVAPSADQICPVLINSSIPPLTLKKIDGSPLQLSDLLKRQPTVLIFYRGGWCPFCNRQLSQLQKIESQLIRMGYQIVAISPDRPEKLKESIQKHQLTYILLSDSNFVAARTLGIAFQVDQSTLERYKGFGIDLEDASGQKNHWLPVPSVFIVNKQGVIQFEYINPNYKVRLDPDILLAAAKTFLKTE